MSEVNAKMVSDLRAKTGAGMMDCKKALAESGGDFEKAIDFLRTKGLSAASKKAGRVAAEGMVGSYIHMGGKIGVLLEVNCESDFVARTEGFQTLVKEIAMHIAAAAPKYVTREQVPAEELEKEKAIYRAQFEGSGKPPQVIEKIVEGKLGSYFSQICLLDQPSVRDQAVSVGEMVKAAIAKTGENITVARFARFKLGDAE